MNLQGSASAVPEKNCVDSDMKIGVGVDVSFKSAIPSPSELAEVTCMAGVAKLAKVCGKGCDCLDKTFGGNGFTKDGQALCKKAGDDLQKLEPEFLNIYSKYKKLGHLYKEPVMELAEGKSFCSK